jgi:hypothetical protein
MQGKHEENVTRAVCRGKHEYQEKCKGGGRMHRNEREITVVTTAL